MHVAARCPPTFEYIPLGKDPLVGEISEDREPVARLGAATCGGHARRKVA